MKMWELKTTRKRWLVVSGTARITRGEETFILEEGDNIEYSTSTPHKTVNVGDTPAEVLWIISPPTSGAADLDQYVIRKSLASGSAKSKSGPSEG